jgi:predicted transcriptional regulator
MHSRKRLGNSHRRIRHPCEHRRRTGFESEKAERRFVARRRERRRECANGVGVRRFACTFSFASRVWGKLSTEKTADDEEVPMSESIRDIMTPTPRSLESGASVVEARIMRDEDVGIVPVTEGDRLVGAVTDRDIAVRVVADGRNPESTTVAEIASRELVTIDPQQDLHQALRLMARHQVRRLPVVEQDGRLVGIVARRTSRNTRPTSKPVTS